MRVYYTPEQAEEIVDRVMNLITPAVYALNEVLEEGKTSLHHARLAYDSLVKLIEWTRKIEAQS